MKVNALHESKDDSFWTFSRVMFGGLAIALFVAGCWFRLVGLSTISMSGDGQFHDFCRAGISVADMFARWPEIMGPGQMAPPVAFTKLFLDVFHLSPVRANVILPSALWGIVTIPVALWVGWRLGGAAFALLLMGVVALNPAHVQMSRLAYFYPPSVLGSFLGLWCMLVSLDSVRECRPLRWWFHVVNVCATILLFYATAGAWPLAVIVSSFHVGCAVFNRFRNRVGWSDLVTLGLIYIAIGIPLLTAPWAAKNVFILTGSNTTTGYWRKIFEQGRQVPIHVQGGHELLKLAWGWTPCRATFGCLVGISGVVTAAILARRKKEWLLPLGLIMTGTVLVVFALRFAIWPFSLRRVSVLWPAFYVLMSLGLYGFWLAGSNLGPLRSLRWCGIIPVVIAFGLWGQSDWMISKVSGVPPYRQIAQWVDGRFPKGTPMVTDRFYTAMCEFNQGDPTTNVVVISTVPNELPEIQEKTRFRDVTRQYLEDNPDALFYCAGHMYERPEVEPWEWPERYFKRRQTMIDHDGGVLERIGQGGSPYPGVIRWPVIYYNTVGDIAAMKRAEGETAFVLYGPDWRPVQTKDYRLWRLLLAGDGALKVFGLGEGAQEVTVEMTGVAVGGTLRVQMGEQVLSLAANQISTQRYRVKLQPGLNSLPVRSHGIPTARLLIAKIVVRRNG